jgi:hypothetical protein
MKSMCRFRFDVLAGPAAGPLELIALIEEPQIIRRILTRVTRG